MLIFMQDQSNLADLGAGPPDESEHAPPTTQAADVGVLNNV